MNEIKLDEFFKCFPAPEVNFSYYKLISDELNPIYTMGLNLEIICRLAHFAHPKRILEIGTAFGDTTLRLAQVCPYAEITTYDVDKKFANREEWQYDQIPDSSLIGQAFKSKPEAARIKKVICSAGRCFEGLFDFVFIDGLHTYEGVLKDTLEVLPFLNEKAIIVWDDYQEDEPGVVKFIDEISKLTEVRIVEKSRICYLQLNLHDKKILLGLK